MSIGWIYQVPDSARDQFAAAKSKADWYEILDVLNAEDAPSFNGEDSFSTWELCLSQQNPGTPVAKLFIGELRSVVDDTGDPHVAFHGVAAVAAIVEDLRKRGASFFAQALAERYEDAELWLYSPLLAFLDEAVQNHAEIAILWEH